MSTGDLLGWVGLALSLGFGVPGLIVAFQPEAMGFFRIKPDTTGMVFVDRANIEDYFQRANATGFARLRDILAREVRARRLPQRPIVVAPAEVDHLLAFLLAAKLNAKFCTVNTDPIWDEVPHLQILRKERYCELLHDDVVVLCMPVITNGQFLRRMLAYMDKRQVRVSLICCAIDASVGAHREELRRRNLEIAAVFRMPEAAPATAGAAATA